MRYARPEFLDEIAASTPLPMVVDGELGMPLDLSQWDCLWEENGDDSELNPDPSHPSKLDPLDQFLLGDPTSTSTPFLGPSTPGILTPSASMPHVPWLRKTEYLSRENASRASLSQDIKQNQDHTIDISRDAQLRDIDASFAAVANSDLASLRHPTKPELTAVEEFEIFPDAEIWANAYDLFRFSERPGDRPVDPTHFHFVRDYETVKVEQEVPNEFLLVLDDGMSAEDDVDRKTAGPPRAKGAYYKNIERKMLLKKKRVNTYEAYGDKWDVVKLTHTPMSAEEAQERGDALAEVVDPMFPLARGDVDADAEGELDDAAAAAAHGLNGAANGVRHEIVDAVDVFGEE
ncbi:RNA polymerase II-associated protein 1 -like protein [Trametes pubescens]|uniref:RNA polymerase II-associated protein 1-like protein n=1 Tax=Trametes pubescens TaxID=154538 RepID=A0A1M2VY24_TRAPU|nr:RNA polymerase II-associated protein 1 -like protein [Trametes pubescens]